MSEKLPEDLDKALRIIANGEQIVIPMTLLRELLNAGYIQKEFKGGWLVNSRGREYLHLHK